MTKIYYITKTSKCFSFELPVSDKTFTKKKRNAYCPNNKNYSRLKINRPINTVKCKQTWAAVYADMTRIPKKKKCPEKKLLTKINIKKKTKKCLRIPACTKDEKKNGKRKPA